MNHMNIELPELLIADIIRYNKWYIRVETGINTSLNKMLSSDFVWEPLFNKYFPGEFAGEHQVQYRNEFPEDYGSYKYAFKELFLANVSLALTQWDRVMKKSSKELKTDPMFLHFCIKYGNDKIIKKFSQEQLTAFHSIENNHDIPCSRRLLP